MTTPQPPNEEAPLLVALGTQSELADYIAETAADSGFDALSVAAGDDIRLRLAAAAADVLVLDTATARRELAAVPPPDADDAPRVVLVVSADAAEAALAREIIATRGMTVVATLQAPLAEDALARALAAARAELPRP
ncbi:hypothetical protein [Caenispirillum bisanense]|uniref:Response regulatory domain-containing protein n=1 Tax=Caenispirillum bisanense TaxID=414052 RepID=A0A286G1C3_9PROT|nr:hypothetical protein [Caenispirillum bisanense]SOD89036.1 hypothetical protein SAMN05421508_10190 [Caenispirillum bisanense]